MGLTKAEIPGYWQKRGERYTGDRTWGPGAGTVEAHKAQVAERAAFIFEDCYRYKETLDFGCGIGMYSKYFEPERYLGIDIAVSHLEIARHENPEYSFVQVASPTFAEVGDFPFEIFFTATVLQHCADDVVDSIFANVAAKRDEPFAFSLYEYANPNWTSRQTVGRTPEEYTAMVAKHFRVDQMHTRSHTIHGTLCAHTMIYVEPNGD